MDPAERLAGDEALQRLHAKRGLPQHQRALAAKAMAFQAGQVGGGVILWAADDAQIFPPQDFQRVLDHALQPTDDEFHRLHHHPLAAQASHPKIGSPTRTAQRLPKPDVRPIAANRPEMAENRRLPQHHNPFQNPPLQSANH